VKRFIVDSMVFLGGCVSFIYVLNFGFGWIEILPDNLPFFGNLDEATATAIFLGALHYFGYSGGRIVNALHVLSGRKDERLTENKDTRNEDFDTMKRNPREKTEK
jgi:type II secretory pathway component PulF